jgi:hypothetical protein
MSTESEWWHPQGLPEPNEWDDKEMIPLSAFTQTDEHFHIGQSYEEEPAKVIACRTCGGKRFNVATGSYYTAIKCISCEWEQCIHNG